MTARFFRLFWRNLLPMIVKVVKAVSRPVQKCGQSGQGQNGHFHFRIRSFAHYNKIL